MKIGILQCGRAPEEIIDRHGDYTDMFRRLLGCSTFTYATWVVLDSQLPESVNDADGWLITGSRHGVYEDHPWIAPLEDFIRDVYAARVPIAGICFGHQIMAQALGGKAEKFNGGWSVGYVPYNLDESEEALGVLAFHQDQVTELPPEATRTGSTPFCENAFIAYRGAAMSMQPHPEFSDEFMRDLIAARGDILPDDIRRQSLEGLGEPLAREYMAEKLRQFFNSNRVT